MVESIRPATGSSPPWIPHCGRAVFDDRLKPELGGGDENMGNGLTQCGDQIPVTARAVHILDAMSEIPVHFDVVTGSHSQVLTALRRRLSAFLPADSSAEFTGSVSV